MEQKESENSCKLRKRITKMSEIDKYTMSTVPKVEPSENLSSEDEDSVQTIVVSAKVESSKDLLV